MLCTLYFPSGLFSDKCEGFLVVIIFLVVDDMHSISESLFDKGL
jgi:hypothetical protein